MRRTAFAFDFAGGGWDDADMDKLDIEALSPRERLDLIARLWDSLESVAVPLPAAQQAELERRLQSADADLADSIPWASLNAELASRGA